MSSNQLERTISWIIKIGLWLIPFLPLYVSGSMLFPFITGKNFAFRIIVELLFVFWIGLVVAWPQYRPRLTPLLKLSTIFIVVLFFADLFSPNPMRAFFSNYERMEGFMMIFHLYLYFLMMVSVFRTRRDWLIFFHSTLAASLLVAFGGLMQKLGYRISIQGGFRVDSTIGNPAYLAAYLSFHVWILLILMRTFWERWWLRIVYGSALLFEVIIIYFTATRGAAVALVLSTIFLLLAVVFYWGSIFPRQPRIRPWIVGLLILAVIVPIVLWQIRSSSFVSSSPALSRFASISLTARTTQARLAIWNMSFQGALERPVLGWGQENYYLIFQKYFDPSLHSSEPWFDRSHNIVLDWFVHAGVIGFAAFFSIIGTVFYLLWRGIKTTRLDPWVGIVVGIAFISYLIQNLFVFDNLNTYLLFFAFLAFTDHLSSAEDVLAVHDEKERGGRRSYGFPSRFWAVGGAALIVFFVLLPPLHIKPIQEARTLIEALRQQQAGAPASSILSAFNNALAYNTFGDTEVREQFAALARGVPGNEQFTKDEQVQFVTLALEEMRKETSRPGKDIKHMLFLSAILSRARVLDPLYAEEAERVLREAIDISPTKQILYFELAQLYLQTGRNDEALSALRSAWLLSPNDDRQSATNLIIVGVLSGNNDVVSEVRDQFDQSKFHDEDMQRISQVYIQIGDLSSAAQFSEPLVVRHPGNAEYRTSLAAILAEIGRVDEAREHVIRAVEVDPNLKEQVDDFLEYLKTK